MSSISLMVLFVFLALLGAVGLGLIAGAIVEWATKPHP